MTAKVKGKAPAFQWYPGDHRRDTAVQACSFEARALWREMLDLMHDGEPRGHLTAGGVEITVEQLARLVGAPLARVKTWLKELEVRKVFSRTNAGVIYSRRMVKDEHISQVRREAGKQGGNPNLVNHSPEQTLNQSGEQNLTPAVADCGLRSAVASSARSSHRDNSKKRSGAEHLAEDVEAASAPLAGAAEIEKLPPGTDAFLGRFYSNAPGERLRDVVSQICATLGAGARLKRGALVRAGSPERLAAKMREVVAEGVRDPDKAIRVLLLKLNDTSDITTAAVKAEHQEIAGEERNRGRELVEANAWLEEHPDAEQAIAEQLARDFPQPVEPGDDILAISRRIAREALVLEAWRHAGSPELARSP